MSVETRRRELILKSSACLGLGVLPILSAMAAPSLETEGARRTLNVGPLRSIKTLREAASIARDGDVVAVDPAEYRGDVAVWNQRGLLLKGAGGKAILQAAGASAENKATFVFRNADATIEDFEFRGARSTDRNGAGIRLDVGSRLVVRRCVFEENENGILTSNDPGSELEVIDSTFVGNGAGDGQSHNLYVGTIAKLSVSGCYLARSSVGHLLKSRARDSVVVYTRLSGEAGTSSYELEFPSGGRALVLGCLIQQGSRSDNSTIVSCGSEGYRWEPNEMTVAFSTIVNDRSRGGVFVRVAPGKAAVRLLNNLLVGPGELDVRVSASELKNFDGRGTDFANPALMDFRLRRSSRLLGAAGLTGSLQREVRPDREYVHPASSVGLESYSPLTALSPGAFQRLAP